MTKNNIVNEELYLPRTGRGGHYVLRKDAAAELLGEIIPDLPEFSDGLPGEALVQNLSGTGYEWAEVGGAQRTLVAYGLADGMSQDQPEITVVNDGGLVADVEKMGGGDMIFSIDGAEITLDCTNGPGVGGAARVALTEGLSTVNHLYVTNNGGAGQLNVSSTLPIGAFAWIGEVIVPDAATWATEGSFLKQRYTESPLDSRGPLSHVRERVRAIGAEYISGITPTVNITTNAASPDDVQIDTTAGQVYQLHRQDFPAFSGGPYYYGNGPNQFSKIDNINEVLQDLNSATMSNRRFNLVIWGGVNGATDSKRYINIPTKSYGNNTQVIADRDNTAVYTVPPQFKGTAFLIARIALRHTTTNSGTWQNLGTYSLLGTPLGTGLGGTGVAASSEFSDSLLRIFDDADTTKVARFETSSISSGQTRTYTMPDKDGTIAMLSDVSGSTSDRIQDSDNTTFVQVNPDGGADDETVNLTAGGVSALSATATGLSSNVVSFPYIAALSTNASNGVSLLSGGNFNSGGLQTIKVSEAGAEFITTDITFNNFDDTATDSTLAEFVLTTDSAGKVYHRKLRQGLDIASEVTVAGSFTAEVGELTPVDTSVGATSTTMLAGGWEIGEKFAVVDSANDASTNNITINFGGNLYGVNPSSYIIDTDGEMAEFVYISATIGHVKVN